MSSNTVDYHIAQVILSITSFSSLSLEARGMKFCIQTRACATGCAPGAGFAWLRIEKNSGSKILLITFLTLNRGVYMQNFSPLASK